MNNKIKLHNKVIDNGYCVKSGAYAVVDANISMELDEYGEYSPYVENTDALNLIDNDKIEAVCAMSDKSPDENEISQRLFSEIKGIKHDPIIGYYSALYAGYVIEGDYRKNASSGGLATWILVELLKSGHIDGVIHVKESNDGDGILFKYDISKTVKDICKGSKSKYYPVEFSRAVNKIKKMPGNFAIVGIPSLIMEIRLLALQDPVVGEKIKYTIGLICGHQKSAKYAESLAWQCGIKPGDLKSIDFRHKIDGAPSDDYATKFTGMVDGQEKTIIKSQKDLFCSNWGHGFFKTKFSDFTDDALNETADISLGDAWLPEYVNDEFGNNVVIVRNQVIAGILENGIRDKKIKLDELEVQDIIRSQSGLIHHTRDELPYRLFQKDSQHKWRPRKRLPASGDLDFLRKRVQNIRMDIAERSRIEYLRACKMDDWEYFENTMRRYARKHTMTYRLITARKIGVRRSFKKIITKMKKSHQD